MNRLRALTAVLAVTVVAACASGGGTVQPAGTSAPAPQPKFVWQDLVTTDAASAKRFYSSLLGWTFTESTREGRAYLIASTAAGPVGGIVDVDDVAGASSHWISYVAVADIDRAAQQVQDAGGKILVAPTAIKAGRVSVVADPQGAALGLLRPATVPPDAASPVTGHFFWREYLARDARTAVDFYKGLLGYTASIKDARLGMEYFVLEGDRPRAGLFQIPASATNVRPNWLPYILVDDPSAVAARVSSLGGQILLDTSPDRRNGTLAIVADPTGGVVALQKFPF